jgi:transposase
MVGCGTATVKRVRRHYLEEGWERAVYDAPRPGRPKKLASREERELIALACSDPPEGEGRWTVRLLAKHSGKDISRNIVQRVLKEDGLKPWREKNVVRARTRRRVQGADV